MQEVFDLVPTLLLCIQEAQFANKVIDLLTVPTLDVCSQFWIFRFRRLGESSWSKLLGGAVHQYELCSSTTGIWGLKKVVPCCNDTV